MVNKKTILYFKNISDLILLNMSFILAVLLRESKVVNYSDKYISITMFILTVLWFSLSKALNIYDDFRSRNFSFEIIEIFKMNIIFILCIIFVQFFTKIFLFNRSILILFFVISFLSMSLKGYLFRRLLSYLRTRGYNVRKVVIVGAGDVGKRFKNMLSNNKAFGYEFIGYIDDDNSKCPAGEYLGAIPEIEKIFQSVALDDVIVALPNNEYEKIETVIRCCEVNAKRTRIIPDYFNFLSPKYKMTIFGKFPLITIREEPLAEYHWRILKRSFDIIISLIIITLILPIPLLIIFIIQKLTSPGPVLFIQERIGEKDKPFKCYKIRTMNTAVSNTKTEFRAIQKDDERVTEFGKFLRKTNLDELPQFFNVIKGDMSIVGPRPHAIIYNKKYSEYVEDIKLRHIVKPGITGWAQINGLRGDVTDEEVNRKRTQKRIDYDKWYIENWSIWLDIQIIFLTIWRMIKGDPHAY
ncbi:MAG: undecaprenyl-phosphate glucose phosphotransferase [Bacteroidota bacterium]